MRARSLGPAASPVKRIGAPASGGPTLIARRYFYAQANATNTFTDTVPAGATRAVVKCVGQGGAAANGGGYMVPAGGAAYARSDIACAAGMTADITIANTAGASTSVALNGVTVLAVGGGNASGATPGTGGLAANCTGQVRRSGGNAGQAGTNGGSSGGNAGGGSGGDVGDPDAAGFGEAGGQTNAATALPGYGGGGGGSTNMSTNQSGKAMIEYWSE